MADNFRNLEGRINRLRDDCRAYIWGIAAANTQTKFAVFSIVAAIVFFIVGLLRLLGVTINPILSFVPLITGGVAGVCAFAIEYRQWISAVWQNPIGKVIVAAVTYLFSSVVLIYSDRLIFEYTELDPSVFPIARNLIAVLPSIIILLVSLWFILLTLHIIYGLLYSYQLARKNPNETLSLGIFSGFAMMSLAVFVVLRIINVKENAEPYLKKLIVFSSFYTNDGFCRDLPKESKIMLLSDKEEVVHVNYAPDGSPVFSVRPCPRVFDQAVP
jgi:hypothetical protein